MSYTVLARKWRPKTFADTVGQEHVLQALVNALESGRLHHAYLFTGPRGTGKPSWRWRILEQLAGHLTIDLDRPFRDLPEADRRVVLFGSGRRKFEFHYDGDGLLTEVVDANGNVVHFHERDCSVQRRNQKVIEEAPSPGIDDATRTRLHEGALALARHVGYVGAGTVEFMVGDDAAGEPTITFLEVNTRLQVEHPVTEFVT